MINQNVCIFKANVPRLSANTSTKMIKLQNYFMSERYDYSYRNNPNQSIVVCLLRKTCFCVTIIDLLRREVLHLAVQIMRLC